MSEIVVTANPKAPNEISFEQRERDLNELERKRLKEIKKSPFTNFYQVNKDSSNYLRSCLKENPRALELLLFIFDHMDKYNAVVCSYKVFQEALGVGQATIAWAKPFDSPCLTFRIDTSLGMMFCTSAKS